MTTAGAVLMMRPSAERMCTKRRKSATHPLSARICFQATVRSRKLTKNGAITSTSSRLRHRPDLNAMQ